MTTKFDPAFPFNNIQGPGTVAGGIGQPVFAQANFPLSYFYNFSKKRKRVRRTSKKNSKKRSKRSKR